MNIGRVVPDEYIMHIRLFDEKIKYATKGGLTLVILEGKYYGFTKCSLKDNYNKILGRTIAKGRAARVRKNVGVFLHPSGGDVAGDISNEMIFRCTIETALINANVRGFVVIHNSIYRLDGDDDLLLVGIVEKSINGLYRSETV